MAINLFTEKNSVGITMVKYSFLRNYFDGPTKLFLIYF